MLGRVFEANMLGRVFDIRSIWTPPPAGLTFRIQELFRVQDFRVSGAECRDIIKSILLLDGPGGATFSIQEREYFIDTRERAQETSVGCRVEGVGRRA